MPPQQDLTQHLGRTAWRHHHHYMVDSEFLSQGNCHIPCDLAGNVSRTLPPFPQELAHNPSWLIKIFCHPGSIKVLLITYRKSKLAMPLGRSHDSISSLHSQPLKPSIFSVSFLALETRSLPIIHPFNIQPASTISMLCFNCLAFLLFAEFRGTLYLQNTKELFTFLILHFSETVEL